MWRWIASLFVVILPVGAALVGDAAAALLLLPAAGGVARMIRGRVARFDQQEKLLYLALAVALVAGAWNLLRDGAAGDAARVAGLAPFALALLAYPWMREHPVIEGLLWTGLAVGGVAWFLARLPEGGGWRAWLAEQRLAGVLALAILLLVPARHFARALGQRYGPLRRAGVLGLVAVAAYGVLALGLPMLGLTPAWTAWFLLVLLAAYGLVRAREREYYRTPVRRAQSLSVKVICKNEADRIGRCLDSVRGWADEIVVLDSGSTDGTVEIVRRYTDKVWVTDWPGYGPQKQRALERTTRDWVLSIDSDEEVTPELRHDIDEALGEKPACVAYKLPWGVITYGKLLDFGQSARAPLRLFVREGSRFTDDQVHETVVPPPGRIGRLRGRLLHHALRDFGHHAQKVAHYGWLGAQKRFAAGRRGGGVIGASLRSLWVFFVVYFVRLGFLDGPAGFVSAAMYAQVSFNKYAGLWSLWRERSG